MQMKIFKINLVICPERRMRNLSRILDFISHLEVQEEEKRERRRERGSKEWKEEGRGVNIVINFVSWCIGNKNSITYTDMKDEVVT